MVFVKTTIITFIFCIMCHVVCEPQQHEISGPRIVGGDPCDYEKYAYAVAIKSSTLCGGSIITLKWVLTAAHCIKPPFIDNGKTTLRTGFNYGRAYVQQRYAKKGIRHRLFNISKMTDIWKPEMRYDIGMIQVDKPFSNTPYLGFASLPEPGFSSKCANGTALGVGYTRRLHESDDISIYTEDLLKRPLMCVNLNITDSKTCEQTWWDAVIDDSIICTSVGATEKDACVGDSGGPLVCEGKVIGIISAGKGCAVPGTSATYTKVESYLDFINETMILNGSFKKCAGNVLRIAALIVLLVVKN